MEAHMYKNIGENSGIKAYKATAHAIIVYFASGVIYAYTYNSTGKRHIEKMKALAQAGKGLATYINKYVRDKYAEQIY